jgi:hypothetical protein
VPAEPSVGTSWTHVVTSRAHFTVGGVRYAQKQVVTTSYDVIGEGSITTGAGTFDALIVETTTESHQTTPGFGTGIDRRLVSRYTQWWARGVGLVRLERIERPRMTIDLIAYRFD